MGKEVITQSTPSSLATQRTTLISFSLFAAVVGKYGRGNFQVPGINIEIPVADASVTLLVLLVIYTFSYFLRWAFIVFPMINYHRRWFDSGSQSTKADYASKNGRLDFDAGYYKISSDEPGRTLNPSNTDEIWFGGVSLGYDGRDSWRVPHEGWHNEVAVSYMGGDANSWNLAFDVRRYHHVKDRHTIATGPYLGLQSGTVGEDVAPHLQFFVGGANSVRGYKLEELGKEIFGKNQLLYTVEYRYLILPRGPLEIFNWSFSIGAEIAAFGDAGLAWSDPEDFNLSRMRSGAGLGIRLLVPGLDSVRFDVARSEDGDNVFNFGVRAIFDERKKRVR